MSKQLPRPPRRKKNSGFQDKWKFTFKDGKVTLVPLFDDTYLQTIVAANIKALCPEATSGHGTISLPDEDNVKVEFYWEEASSDDRASNTTH
jgi:hypothetical protein